MAFELNENGLSIDTFDEVYDRLAEKFKAIYGDGINLDQNTPDGQRLGILSKEILDGQGFAQLLYSQLDIDFSFGAFLDVLCKLSGVNRRPATLSQVDLTLVSDRDLTLQAGYTVEDTNGQRWSTDSDNTILNGSNTITVFSNDFGAIEALAGTITTPISIVLGVQSITNPLDAIAGIDEETDPELRYKRNNSLHLAGFSTLGSITSKMLALAGVTDVRAFENDTDTTDTNGIPPYSIWLVIEGGEVADIAEVFAKDKTGGTGMKGAITATYSEDIPRPNGGSVSISHDYKFDRPSEQTLYVRCNATPVVSGGYVDPLLVASNIATKVYEISEQANASMLYSFAYSSGSGFNVSAMEVSNDGLVWTDTTLATAVNEKWLLDAGDVTVTVI